jgi:hypothetical protein
VFTAPHAIFYRFAIFDGFFEKFSPHHFGFPLLSDGDDEIDQPIRSQSRNSGLSGLQGQLLVPQFD